MAKNNKAEEAFAISWNDLPEGSVYIKDPFRDWFEPIQDETLKLKACLTFPDVLPQKLSRVETLRWKWS